MKNKKYIILIICIIALFSMQFVSASDNTDMDVLADANDDGILLAPTETQSFSNLKDVIDSANDGDEITLEFNYKYSDGDPRTGINITKDLVINGNGATIDGVTTDNHITLFNISSGVTLTLKNLTIINLGGLDGWSPVTQYSVILSKGNLNIYDCTFENNGASRGYGEFEANGSVINSIGDIYIY